MNPAPPPEPEVHVGAHVLCMIDLLAQKEFLKDWAEWPIPLPLSPSFLAGIKKTAGTVEWFRQAFSDYFAASAVSSLPSSLIEQLPPDKQALFTRTRECSLGIQQFSDTFVFYAPFENSFGDKTLMPVHNMLVACCWAVTNALAGGVPLRGVICLGNGLKLRAGDFYGPVLAEAHELETTRVGHPRVILSAELTKMLRGGSGFSQESTIETVMQQIRAKCLKLLCSDPDGDVIVDYLGEEIYNLAPESRPLFLQAIEKAYRFVRSEQSRFQCANNEKLNERYLKVRQYMEARLPIWNLQHLAAQIT